MIVWLALLAHSTHFLSNDVIMGIITTKIYKVNNPNKFLTLQFKFLKLEAVLSLLMLDKYIFSHFWPTYSMMNSQIIEANSYLQVLLVTNFIFISTLVCDVPIGRYFLTNNITKWIIFPG